MHPLAQVHVYTPVAAPTCSSNVCYVCSHFIIDYCNIAIDVHIVYVYVHVTASTHRLGVQDVSASGTDELQQTAKISFVVNYCN